MFALIGVEMLETFVFRFELFACLLPKIRTWSFESEFSEFDGAVA